MQENYLSKNTRSLINHANKGSAWKNFESLKVFLADAIERRQLIMSI